MTLKYRQRHRHSYHLKADVWFLISNFSFWGCILYNFRDIGLGRGKWPSNITQGHQKWHQSKAVWLPISILSIVTFATSRTVLGKFDVKQSNDLDIYRQGYRQSHHVKAVVWPCVCKMFERQWMKEAKIAIFNDPTFIWRPPGNPRGYMHKPYTASNISGLHFCRWQYYMGSSVKFSNNYVRKHETPTH